MQLIELFMEFTHGFLRVEFFFFFFCWSLQGRLHLEPRGSNEPPELNQNIYIYIYIYYNIFYFIFPVLMLKIKI